MPDGAPQIPNATPFDLIAEDAETWLAEARNYADGQPVTTQPQADDVARIIDALRQTAKAADDQRKIENKPHDDAKAVVQAKYAPLFADPKTKTPGKVWMAIEALNAAKRPFLIEQERKLEEARKAAKEEADRAARDAAEALRMAASADLSAREDAEAKARAAEDAARAAKEADKAKAHAHGGGRAQGLRTKVVGVMSNPVEAMRAYYRENPQPFIDLTQSLIDADARQNRRWAEGKGVTFREERV